LQYLSRSNRCSFRLATVNEALYAIDEAEGAGPAWEVCECAPQQGSTLRVHVLTGRKWPQTEVNDLEVELDINRARYRGYAALLRAVADGEANEYPEELLIPSAKRDAVLGFRVVRSLE